MDTRKIEDVPFEEVHEIQRDLFLGEEFLEEDRAGSEESGGYGIASCLHAVLYVAG